MNEVVKFKSHMDYLYGPPAGDGIYREKESCRRRGREERETRPGVPKKSADGVPVGGAQQRGDADEKVSNARRAQAGDALGGLGHAVVQQLEGGHQQRQRQLLPVTVRLHHLFKREQPFDSNHTASRQQRKYVRQGRHKFSGTYLQLW